LEKALVLEGLSKAFQLLLRKMLTGIIGIRMKQFNGNMT
jgi:hypothetical protein